MYATHATLYGNALSEITPEIEARLAKFDHLIVSPGVYARVPDALKPKCLLYWSWFVWPRYDAAPGDWQPGPGDLLMPEIEKTNGGHSYLYTISDLWKDRFVQQMLRWAMAHKDQFAGFFLEDWQRSHSWWGVPKWDAITDVPNLPERMRSIEDMAGWISRQLGSERARRVVALSGYPQDFGMAQTKWYCESFGASWQPIESVRERARPGMFIQVNSADAKIREAAADLAEVMGGSLGMQPTEGVLAYSVVEDVGTWPQRSRGA